MVGENGQNRQVWGPEAEQVALGAWGRTGSSGVPGQNGQAVELKCIVKP